MSAGDQAPMRSSQHPTTSGHAASGVTSGRTGATTGSGFTPQPLDAAAAATNEIAYRVRLGLLVFGATSILLILAFATRPSGAFRMPIAQTLPIAGLGVGAPSLSGIVITGVGAGTLEFNGGVIAPLYFRIEQEGSMRGVSVSAFNRLSGVQHGLAIGVLNIAEELRGVQIGLINIARRNPRGRRVLSIVNWGSRG
jgi:hypothetical protein